MYASGAAIRDAFSTSVLVDALLQRRGAADLHESREV